MKTIAIVGAGASGLMAAIFAANNQDNKVIVFEKTSKAGRKILASGNGRCNFSNINANPKHYNKPEFVSEVLTQFGVKETLQFFNKLGLLEAVDEEGRIYPYSYNSSTVLNLLLNECSRLNVEIRLNSKIDSIIEKGGRYHLLSNGLTTDADRVIITAGSKAGINSEDDIYSIVKQFKHHITPLSPALSPLYTDKRLVVSLAGIRVKGKVSLLCEGRTVHSEDGEILFKKDGLSGIAVFNLSLFYARKGSGSKYSLSLDLMPNLTEKDIIDRFNKLNIPIEQFLDGIFNPMIGNKLVKDSGHDINRIAKSIKNMVFPIKGVYGYPDAQITIGGVDTKEISPITLESKLHKGLYFAGEIMDIDGECGGYNLQWAWSSGAIAGLNQK